MAGKFLFLIFYSVHVYRSIGNFYMFSKKKNNNINRYKADNEPLDD